MSITDMNRCKEHQELNFTRPGSPSLKNRLIQNLSAETRTSPLSGSSHKFWGSNPSAQDLPVSISAVRSHERTSTAALMMALIQYLFMLVVLGMASVIWNLQPASAIPLLGGPPPDVYPEPFPFFGSSEEDLGEPEYKNSLLGFYDYLAEQIADQDPEVAPGLVEGDIATHNALSYYLWRLGLRWNTFPAKRWENATVPYHISPKYSPTERNVIQTAIYSLSFLTCIRFVPYDGKAADYLLIWPVEKPAGCWSFIGKQGGQQIVSLERPTAQSPKCLGGPGRAMHEIMHALGVFHEQSRHDRDKYVTVQNGNIISNFKHNFAKQSPRNATYNYEYDYHSIMHYGMRYFSVDKGKKATLVPKKKNVVLGQRLGLSRLDCMKLNHLYSCFDGSEYEREKYETFCAALGM